MKKYLLLMKRYWQKKKFINNIIKKQMNKTKKKMLKKKYKQPEPRKYEGVFWNGVDGHWWDRRHIHQDINLGKHMLDVIRSNESVQNCWPSA